MKASTVLFWAGSAVVVYLVTKPKLSPSEQAIAAQQAYYEKQIRQGQIPGAKP